MLFLQHCMPCCFRGEGEGEEEGDGEGEGGRERGWGREKGWGQDGGRVDKPLSLSHTHTLTHLICRFSPRR